LESYTLVSLLETNLALETERFRQGIATQAQVEAAQKALLEGQARLPQQ